MTTPNAQAPQTHGAAAPRLAGVPWGAVALFIVLAGGLAWLVALPLWLRGAESPGFATLLGVLAPVMMWTPALATLAVVFLARVPAGERLRFLGVWPLRPAKRVVWFIVAAVFAPTLLVAASVAVAAAFGWAELDLVEFSGFAAAIAASVPAGVDVPLPPVQLLVLAQLLSLPLGVVINAFAAFGEEIGWRGWLLPALRPLGTWPALALSGVIWGLWHSPLILLGYNFGLTDWRGVALMTVGCVFWGALLGWTRLRSGSVWPAVIGHASLNASAGLLGLVVAVGADVDPALVLPLGVCGWIVIAVALVILVATGQFSPARQPELAPRKARGGAQAASTQPAGGTQQAGGTPPPTA
ncbi:CPBP family intramembrane glutamic endopeptidase [Leucobacter chromiireducens]|uniref:CPBP family intramembrane glutamic endopeptidase n=1 Tax=Leucobacter chromiireducens TaxID=283877 RepID=UPI000F62CB65|nr:CPBP family intramembrane glutamic endopeptidase [Leucobacter chromiireducens]